MKPLLKKAQEEITNLRRENEILRGKVDIMELFACVLRTKPYTQPQRFDEDIVWSLQMIINKM